MLPLPGDDQPADVRFAAEQRLALRAAGGDAAAREELMLALQGLVGALAGEACPIGGGVFDELMQEGNLSLLEAIEAYDPERDVPFVAFAATKIRRALAEYRSEQATVFGAPIRAPRSRWRQLTALERAAEQLRNAGHDPTVDELAASAGLSARAAAEALMLRTVGRAELSDAVDVADDGPAPEDRVYAGQVRAAVRGAVAGLDERQRAVVEAIFDGEETEEQIAARFGVPRSNVAALKRRALAKLAFHPALRSLAAE